MKRFLIMTMLAALLLSVTACAGNTESPETQSSASGTAAQEQLDERKDGGPDGGPGGIAGGAPDGGRGGQGGQGGPGGGMSAQSSEPDEELQAILDEVQDKYELLTFTDPDTALRCSMSCLFRKTTMRPCAIR